MTNEEIKALFERRMQEEQRRKVENYRQLNALAKPGAILFTGSSLMEHFPVGELCLSAGINKTVYNRGVGGFTTDDFLREIGPLLLDLRPGRVFINIGTNDIKNDPAIPEGWQAHLQANYDEILRRLKEALPACEVYVMAYYPVNPDAACAKNGPMWHALQVRTNDAVARANTIAAGLAAKYGYRFINVNAGLTDTQGRLKEEFTLDGVHMCPAAYAQVLENLTPYL